MEHAKEEHKDKVYHCPYGDFSSPNHSAVLLHFDLSRHAGLASPQVEAVEVLKFENKSYGQDNMMEVQDNMMDNMMEIQDNMRDGRLGQEQPEAFNVSEDQQLRVKEHLLIKQDKSENHLFDQNPGVKKKAGRARNIFSTAYKSKEEKECQGGIQCRYFLVQPRPCHR